MSDAEVLEGVPEIGIQHLFFGNMNATELFSGQTTSTANRSNAAILPATAITPTDAICIVCYRNSLTDCDHQPTCTNCAIMGAECIRILCDKAGGEPCENKFCNFTHGGHSFERVQPFGSVKRRAVQGQARMYREKIDQRKLQMQLVRGEPGQAGYAVAARGGGVLGEQR